MINEMTSKGRSRQFVAQVLHSVATLRAADLRYSRCGTSLSQFSKQLNSFTNYQLESKLVSGYSPVNFLFYLHLIKSCRYIFDLDGIRILAYQQRQLTSAPKVLALLIMCRAFAHKAKSFSRLTRGPVLQIIVAEIGNKRVMFMFIFVFSFCSNTYNYVRAFF